MPANNTRCALCGIGIYREPGQIRKSKSGRAFCSRSCSAKWSNRTPKRAKTRSCKDCGKPVHSNRTYCHDCWETRKNRDPTLGEITGKARYQVHAQVREMARRAYKNAGRSLVCVVCGYTKKVDVGHISPLSDFDLSTPLSEVNAQTNLMAFCPNHHWEFDHQQMSPDMLAKVRDVLSNLETNALSR